MDEETRLRRRITRLKREQRKAYARRRELIMVAVDDMVGQQALARRWGISQPLVNLIVKQELEKRAQAQR